MNVSLAFADVDPVAARSLEHLGQPVEDALDTVQVPHGSVRRHLALPEPLAGEPHDLEQRRARRVRVRVDGLGLIRLGSGRFIEQVRWPQAERVENVRGRAARMAVQEHAIVGRRHLEGRVSVLVRGAARHEAVAVAADAFETFQ